DFFRFPARKARFEPIFRGMTAQELLPGKPRHVASHRNLEASFHATRAASRNGRRRSRYFNPPTPSTSHDVDPAARADAPSSNRQGSNGRPLEFERVSLRGPTS